MGRQSRGKSDAPMRSSVSPAADRNPPHSSTFLLTTDPFRPFAQPATNDLPPFYTRCRPDALQAVLAGRLTCRDRQPDLNLYAAMIPFVKDKVMLACRPDIHPCYHPFDGRGHRAQIGRWLGNYSSSCEQYRQGHVKALTPDMLTFGIVLRRLECLIRNRGGRNDRRG